MLTVNMLDAKSSLSRLVDAVERGVEEEIIIARNGKPAAKLVSVQAPKKPSGKRRLFLMEGQYPDMSLEDFNAEDPEIAKLFGI